MLHPTLKDKFCRGKVNLSGGARIVGKGCHPTGQGQGNTRVLLETVSGAKEGRTIQAGD